MEVYKVGIAIALTGGIDQALSRLSHQFIGVHKSVQQIQSGIGRWRTGLLGVASVVGGSMILGGLAKIASHGDKFLDQQAKLQILGLKNKEIAEATATAWANTRVAPGSSVSENLKSIGEMVSVVGLPEALKTSGKFAQLDQVLKAVTGKEGAGYTTARAGELLGVFSNKNTGAFDETGFSKFMDLIARAAVMTHGKVTPAEMLNFAKQAGPAAANLTDDGFLTEVAIIQAMGGHRAGTAAAALNRQFAGGIMSQRVAKELMRIGVAQQGDFDIGRGGQVIAKTDAMKEVVTALQRDALSAIAGVILPKLQAAGFNTNEKLSAEIYRMIGTGPAQREVYELIRGRSQIAGEIARGKQTLSIEESTGVLNQNSPVAIKGAFHAGYENMMTAIGAPLMQMALPVMSAVTKMFSAFGEFASKHGDAIKVIGAGLAVLGAGAVAAGIASLTLALGVGGPIVAGFALAASAVTALGLAFANYRQIFEWIAGPAKPYTGAGSTPGPNDSPGGAAFDRPLGPYRRRSFEPPPAAGGPQQQSWNLSVDGTKIAAVTTRYLVKDMGGPAQGSSFFDATSGHTPVDLSYARVG
jgi:hypothetical protein